jgi:hypothetical protein
MVGERSCARNHCNADPLCDQPLTAGITPGFGSELVERLIARELKGEGKMALLPESMRCTIEIPLGDEHHNE